MCLNLVAQYLYGIMNNFSSSPLGICVLFPDRCSGPGFGILRRLTTHSKVVFKYLFPCSNQTFPEDLGSRAWNSHFSILKSFPLFDVFHIISWQLAFFPLKTFRQPHESVLIYFFKYTYTILHDWDHSKHAGSLQAVFFLLVSFPQISSPSLLPQPPETSRVPFCRICHIL